MIKSMINNLIPTAINILRWIWPTINDYFNNINMTIDFIDNNDHYMIRIHRYVQYYLQLSCIRYLFTYLLPFTYHQRLLLFDVSIFMGMTREYNLIMMLATFNAFYVYRNFYSTENRQLNKILINFVLKSNNQHHHNGNQSIYRYLKIHLLRRNFELFILGSLAIYSLIFYLLYQIQMNYEFFFNSHQPQWYGWLKIVIIEMHCIIAFIDALIIFHTTEMIFCFMFGFSWIIFHKYPKISYEIDHKKPEQFTRQLLKKFLHKNCHLFLLVNRIMKSYSKFLFILLIWLIPANLYTFPKIFFVSQQTASSNNNSFKSVDNNIISRPLILFMAFLIHHIGLFIIHYICTQYIHRIHRCGIHSLFGLITMLHRLSSFRFSLRLHWKICYYLEKFHTKQPYGFSYGRFGLITMIGFVWVSTHFFHAHPPPTFLN